VIEFDDPMRAEIEIDRICLGHNAECGSPLAEPMLEVRFG